MWEAPGSGEKKTSDNTAIARMPRLNLATPELGSKHVLVGLKARPHLNSKVVQVTGVLPNGKFKVVLIGGVSENEYAVDSKNLASAEPRAANGDRASGDESAPVHRSDVSRLPPAALALLCAPSLSPRAS